MAHADTFARVSDQAGASAALSCMAHLRFDGRLLERPEVHLVEHAAGAVGAVFAVGLVVDFANERKQVALVLRQALLKHADFRDLAVQRLQKFFAWPRACLLYTSPSPRD